jgi:hypothetical protein
LRAGWTKVGYKADKGPYGRRTGRRFEDDLRPEYDRSILKNGVRGKHLAEYRSDNDLVLLDADAAKAYPAAEAVNDALRRLMQSTGAA